MNQGFDSVDVSVALFVGHPLEDGQELDALGYARADFGPMQPSLYGPHWGLTNSEFVDFPKPEEDWAGVTHIALIVEGWDVVLRCSPIQQDANFFDPVMDPLKSDGEMLIKEGQMIGWPPETLFVYGGMCGCAADHDEQSNYIN